MFSRLSTCCSSVTLRRLLLNLSGMLASLFYGMPGNPASTESSYPKRRSQTSGRDLLNDDLLLLRVHPTLRRLCSYGDHSFSGRQGLGEIMEDAIRADHRNLTAIHHHPRAGLRL